MLAARQLEETFASLFTLTGPVAEFSERISPDSTYASTQFVPLNRYGGRHLSHLNSDITRKNTGRSCWLSEITGTMFVSKS